ncbi:hypothetical protein CFBP6109_04248 [Pseudomonas syringae pv. cerasicola]|nr:hypothetical protein CFBP6109_04248 [Pseudomonas syringae pv. cerasicola]SPF13159.1 hypothetical protein PSCFBP6110_00642 [Pseudomonas syringae pv. cerasicola]
MHDPCVKASIPTRNIIMMSPHNPMYFFPDLHMNVKFSFLYIFLSLKNVHLAVSNAFGRKTGVLNG